MRRFTHLFKTTIFCFGTLNKSDTIKSHILLKDCLPPMDPLNNILITDVDEGDLHETISDLLKKKYLGVCQESSEQIEKQTKFSGITYGDGFRMFITMPTRLNIHYPCLYVHYLLDSGSPFTTLTHQALCALHGKRYSTNTTFSPSCYSVGPCNIEVNLSDPSPGIKDTIYNNINVLGRNFCRQFKKIHISEDIKGGKFEMIVQK